MTEKEYRISIFEEKFNSFRDKNIILYGAAANAKAIIEKYDSKYNIIGIMSEKEEGQYVYGKRVLTKKEIIELQVDIIIIAAQISSSETIYDRIVEFCVCNNILLYDMYGNNALEVHKEITRQKTFYLNRDIIECKNSIDKYDVICFDMMDTFVMRRVYSVREIFELVSQSLSTHIQIENYKKLRSELELRCYSLNNIYPNLQRAIGLNMEETNILKQKEIELEVENSFVREQMKELYWYAKNKGKKVIFVSDWRLPAQKQKEILDRAGIIDYDYFYHEGTENISKINGMYRFIMQDYRKEKILHIGDEYLSDWVAPQMYGMGVWVLFSPFETLQASNCRINKTKLNLANYKWILGELLADVFGNPFVLAETKGRISLGPEQGRLIGEMSTESNDTSNTYKPVLFPIIGKKQNIGKYEDIVFPLYENPQVSIIIPVYNQFEYTYNCLKAVLKHTQNVKYEVIVADDCSDDYTKDLEKIVKGITVIHNTRNLKFLLNCNNATKSAKGKYLLFLNNDTQVQPDWLKPLVDLLEIDESIGMTGSKLVYPDGRLQEAGGILWKDASAWNFGNRQDPDRAEFNYVKDVDYISGASLMIRKEVWKEIGGFDERYAPAYCEDSDLAFEVRKHGKRVVYQPLSVVVHFESISNNGDTIKEYQKVNNKKLFDKWKNTLERDHFENGINVFLARDRSRDKKHILVIDQYVPTYDKDAGCKTSYMYLKLFKNMGMQVTFIGDNFNKMEPYGTIVNQMGIEILYGKYYYDNLEKWLIGNLCYFDYVYLQRPHITIKYIDVIKKYGRAKILYYAHDLHYLRTFRQYQLEKKPELLESSQKFKKMEYEIFEKADVGYVVSDDEQAVMQEALPHKIVKSIPGYLYDEFPKDINKDFSSRKDLLFVGGFGHTPNVDGVLWFAENVFPLVVKEYPQIKWHIVGNNVPEAVETIADDNIIVEGFLTDEALEKIYRGCRMVVAPLRFGAGVKGKIVEAAHYQVPIVTTTIGVEGLDINSGIFEVEDDAGKMAAKICALYEDYDKLRKMSDGCIEFINNYFTSAVAAKILGQDIDFGE